MKPYLRAIAVFHAMMPAALYAQDAGIRSWEFNSNNSREGWSVPQRLTGAVMGGSLWLTPTPKEKDPGTLASLNYQIYGDYNVVQRIAAGEQVSVTGAVASDGLSIAGPSSVDVVSPPGLAIEVSTQPQQQLQLRIRVLNLSPARNVDLKWRSKDMDNGTWSFRRCNLRPDLNQWQDITCFLKKEWRGTVDQIALGISENVIRGDLWIDSIRIETGAPEPIPARPDIASATIVPRISIPQLSQERFADAFKVLDEGLVVEVPAYGFPYPFTKPSGDAKYGDYPWIPDAALNAAAAAWVNQPFAENVMRGFHAIQSFNPDGRLSGYPWEAVGGQVADINQCALFFFESAYAIAVRSRDAGFRAQVYEMLRKHLDWYLSPIKRDRETGLITGTHEEVLFPVSSQDIYGFSYVQSRAPVNLNVSIAVAASLTARLADDLGKKEDAKQYRRVFDELKAAINALLWHETDGLYYDYDLQARRLLRYRTAATFLPLRLGIAPEDRQQRLIGRLTDPTQFNWAKTPLPTIAMTEVAPQMTINGQSMAMQFIWALTNTPVIAGLEESGHATLAAELNWSMLRLFQGNYFEFYNLSGAPAGGERYGFTASAYIRGIIEHLLGVTYDAAHRQIRIVPYVPPALYGKDLVLNDLILPVAERSRLSLRINQSSPTAAQIAVNIAGKLPDGTLQIVLPGVGKATTVRTKPSLTVNFP